MLFAEASALDHVLDGYVWPIFHELHWQVSLPSFERNGEPYGLSKYSILMMIAAALILWIYLPLAKKIETGDAPKGIFWNLFEAILTFVRDNIAKPYIGKDADKYVHFLWTIFLFVLFCNLLGMMPFMGSPTASFSVTSVLALSVFVFIHWSSIRAYGLWAHLCSFAPSLDLPIYMKIPILLMLWPIEFGGLMLKCFVLSVRLFANMFAGHIVLGTILLFIPLVRNTGWQLEVPVTTASVLGVVALSFLELFVAFLQAFLFAFLTALFLGGILEHAEHATHAGAQDDHGHGGHAHGGPPNAGEEDVHLKTGAPGHAH
jgi:F-type H+-transporting ATPase subunit a